MADDYGRIMSVQDRVMGSQLTMDHAAGATTLSLEDVFDFEEPEPGEFLPIQVASDTDLFVGALDDVASTLSVYHYDDTLVPPAYVAGTINAYNLAEEVRVRPLVKERIAAVLLDDAEEDSQTVRGLIPNYLWDRIPEGPRDDSNPAFLETEAVALDEGDGEFIVTNIIGEEPENDGAFMLDDSMPVRKLVRTVLSAISDNLGNINAGTITGVRVQTNKSDRSRVVMENTVGESDRIKFYTFAEDLRGDIHGGAGGLVVDPVGGANVIIGRNALKFADDTVAQGNPGGNLTQGSATDENVPVTKDAANLGQAISSITPKVWLKFIKGDGQAVWVPGFW